MKKFQTQNLIIYYSQELETVPWLRIEGSPLNFIEQRSKGIKMWTSKQVHSKKTVLLLSFLINVPLSLTVLDFYPIFLYEYQVLPRLQNNRSTYLQKNNLYCILTRSSKNAG